MRKLVIIIAAIAIKLVQTVQGTNRSSESKFLRKSSSTISNNLIDNG